MGGGKGKKYKDVNAKRTNNFQKHTEIRNRPAKKQNQQIRLQNQHADTNEKPTITDAKPLKTLVIYQTLSKYVSELI